jgi:ureidoglycolate hydrolase
LTALPLTHEAFVEYGSVIQAYSDVNAVPHQMVVNGANHGTAIKFSHTFAKVKASFPGNISPSAGFAVYRAQPLPSTSCFTVKILERHPHNNQAFFAIGGRTKLWDNDLENSSNKYLVIVAKNGCNDRPDLRSLRVFIASTSQGVLYDTGIWHHPLIALKTVRRFIHIHCLIDDRYRRWTSLVLKPSLVLADWTVKLST